MKSSKAMRYMFSTNDISSIINSFFEVFRHGGKSFCKNLLDLFNDNSLGGSRIFCGSVISSPQFTLLNFSLATFFGSFCFTLLFFKESLLRGEFRFSLFEVGASGSESCRNHCLCTFKVINKSVELLNGSCFIISIFNKRSFKRLEKLRHFFYNDVQSIWVDSRSNFHERSDWVSVTDFRKLSQCSGSC
jgi:hypothetical protein